MMFLSLLMNVALVAGFRINKHRSGTASARIASYPNTVWDALTNGTRQVPLFNPSDISKFGILLLKTDLPSLLQNASNMFTLFVPHNSAFNKLPQRTQDDVQALDGSSLKEFLFFHIVSKPFAAEGLPKQVKTVSGDELAVERGGGLLTVNGVNVVEPNIYANNGAVHIIDGILWGGSCPNGALIAPSRREQRDHCGRCDSGFSLQNNKCQEAPTAVPTPAPTWRTPLEAYSRAGSDCKCGERITDKFYVPGVSDLAACALKCTSEPLCKSFGMWVPTDQDPGGKCQLNDQACLDPCPTPTRGWGGFKNTVYNKKAQL